MRNNQKKKILNISLSALSAKEILEYILDDIKHTKDKYYIVTPNPEIVVIANKNLLYSKILNEAEFSLCDGTGLFLATKILRQDIPERITGIAFMTKLCQLASENKLSVGLLGAKNGVARITADKLKKTYPRLRIVFIGEEWRESDNKIEIDILFVAFGAPKQEFWIYEHLKDSHVRIMIGVGGSFDELSGRIAQAPGWVDKSGLKWMWRLIHEPWRWRRQLSLLTFLRLVIKEVL